MLKAIFLSVLVGLAVQPVFSQFDKLVPEVPQDGAAFGYEVSQDEDYLIVGAKDEVNNDVKGGGAYIYHLENGNWIEQAHLVPELASAGEFFGISVALSGDFALVGANGNDIQGTNSGTAYIYQRQGESWDLFQTLSPQELQPFDEFGISVDLSGSVAIIGAYSDATNGLFAGAAYVYEFIGQSWIETAKLLPEEVESEDKFGRSVDTDGKRIIVCRVLGDEQGTNSGAAYIYSKDGTGQWIQEAKLLAPDGTEEDRFGRSVGIAGEYAVVGAVLDDDNGNNSGAAYIFNNTPDGWVFRDKVTPSDGAAEDFFGYALSFTPGYLLVGALNKDGTGSNTGAAYLFNQSGNDWVEIEKLTAADEFELGSFGESVDINGSWLTIGAPYWGDNDMLPGTVYIRQAPLPLGRKKDNIAQFAIYPNPVTDEFRIFTPPGISVPVTFELYNSSGNLVRASELKKHRSVSVKDLPKGVYILVVHTSTYLANEKLLLIK